MLLTPKILAENKKKNYFVKTKVKFLKVINFIYLD